jgi:aminoglycoside phosphotransferase (APT) family kinase protein
MTLAPEVRSWLTSVGVPEPEHVRRFKSARSADLIVLDELVLRWYGTTSHLDDEPDAVVREVAILGALAETSVPAPRLVAWSDDPPAVLATLVPGEPRVDLPDVGALREILRAIHQVEPEPLARWAYRGYHEGFELERPAWWVDADLWQRAMAQTMNARPTAPPVVIHRDFHPGNVLWTGDSISGVVDWGNACLGPAAFDVAHYRVNLAQLPGADSADAFLSGDPAWDLEAAFGFLDWSHPPPNETWAGPWPHVPVTVARRRLESFVARAVAALR